MYTLLDN